MSRLVRFLALIILVMMTMPFISAEGAEMPTYEITVEIRPEEHRLVGRVRITVPEGIEPYLLSSDLEITTMIVNGKEQKPGEISADSLKATEGEQIIEIEYAGTFGPRSMYGDVNTLGQDVINVIDPSEVLLLSNWYPALKGFAVYALTVTIPSGFDVVSEADTVTEQTDENKKTIQFDFPHPASGITLVAGNYSRNEDRYGGIEIRTLFLRDDRELALQYLEKAKEYIGLYESMIGEFPYKRFTIVESTLQEGFSFPTYTLLGSKVLGLPFIPETSLGHEILHQWFGNYVYVDYGSGNWTEGLTTYLSDHWFEDGQGRGAAYRKKILIDYMNYVLPENEISLREFVVGDDRAARAVGYGKSAMVFHMLRKRVGDDDFFDGLRNFIASFRYTAATWDDIQGIFNPSGDERLDRFFSQWVGRKGMPSLDVGNERVSFRDGAYVFAADIVQKGEVYELHLNASIQAADGKEDITVKSDQQSVRLERKVSSRPDRYVLDSQYDVMRHLHIPERPPVISAFTGNKSSIAIIPESERDVYGEIEDLLLEWGFTVKHEDEVVNAEIINNAVLIASENNSIYRRLFADRTLEEGGLVINVEKNPLNPSRVAVVVSAKSDHEAKAFRKLSRYGNYSLLVFEDGKNVYKGIKESDEGIVRDLAIEPSAVEVRNTVSLSDVIQEVHDKRVIFVGELHDIYSHHVMQYELIKQLHERNGNLIIGMEMFQQPFQKYLDQYISGDIDELSFLKKTEYYTRWKFDYNLYRDILHYAKHNRIPVIALNLRKEIIGKVSRNGIDALSEQEAEEIPADIDMTNLKYRESMKAVFHQHATRGKKSFHNFFQSQILWDETMAHNVAKALETFPDSQMIVLAGNGHLQYAWGIPDRVGRLTGESMAIILNSGVDAINKDLADFILYPPDIDVPESPKMGVFLKESAGSVEIEKVFPGTPASRAELKKGDVIVSIDDTVIRDISDIKITLLDHEKGDSITITIERSRFLLGPKRMDLQLTL